MTSRSPARVIGTLLRWLLGVLLLWAAVSKLAGPSEFLASLYAYQLPLPRVLLQLTAVVLPWVELLCGLLLLAGLWTESALACATALLVVFLAATGQAWARGLELSCGCFTPEVLGLSGKDAGALAALFQTVAFAFYRNLALAVVTAVLLWDRVSAWHGPGDQIRHGAAESATNDYMKK